jgi:dCMP deaminase
MESDWPGSIESSDLAPDERITRDQMFMEIAEVVRKRSTCLRGRVGCVIVQDNRIIASGYNGAPPGEPHCFELGCEVQENNHEAGCQRAIHAEANAIAYAARGSMSTQGATMYCTHAPCLKCAQLMISAGIVELHYVRPYRLVDGSVLFSGGGRQILHHHSFTMTEVIDV